MPKFYRFCIGTLNTRTWREDAALRGLVDDLISHKIAECAEAILDFQDPRLRKYRNLWSRISWAWSGWYHDLDTVFRHLRSHKNDIAGVAVEEDGENIHFFLLFEDDHIRTLFALGFPPRDYYCSRMPADYDVEVEVVSDAIYTKKYVLL